MIRKLFLLAAAAALCPSGALASTFFDFDEGIAADDPRVERWATLVAQVTRGPIDITDPTGDVASFGIAANATGPSDALTDGTFGANSLVSLGDGGSITLEFGEPISNIDGPDFAVFENTFFSDGTFAPVGAFAELAFVEVSSNRTDFFRFPSTSLTPTGTQVDAFGVIDSTDVSGLAGAQLIGTGTPFDLEDLANADPLLDINAIVQVRIVDVIGSIDPALGSVDSDGRLINDPFPTLSITGGFDLDAIAVLRAVPEPTTAALVLLALVATGSRRP